MNYNLTVLDTTIRSPPSQPYQSVVLLLPYHRHIEAETNFMEKLCDLVPSSIDVKLTTHLLM